MTINDWQGRPQADAQDARASTKLMDLEVCLSKLPYLKHWFWLIQQYTIDFTFTVSLFSVFWTVNFVMKWLPYDYLADQ